jgi:RHS repeat-associated protein
MLNKVITPNNTAVNFTYDPLGRRIAKVVKEKVCRYIWDGNVLLHEWKYEGGYPPLKIIDEEGIKETKEPIENVVTWLYEEGSFIPCTKIEEEKRYSIVADYLGTPTHAYNETGSLVWERELDCYGAVRKEKGEKGLVPQLYQGQYVDSETGLAYNRFRYYDSESGGYISQDPIGLLGGAAPYQYVLDTSICVDIFGLETANIVRYKPGRMTPQPGARGTAIDRAWREEQELVNRTGKGTRDWTPEEIDSIKAGRSGKELTSVMSNAGYTGHHINNVAEFPELKGDPRNIIFLQNANHLSGIDEHLHSNWGHRGHYENATKGRLIDRSHSH